MPGLQQQLRQLFSRWGERVLQCNGDECAGARRAWERISTGASSVCVHGLRYCFPHCFERDCDEGSTACSQRARRGAVLRTGCLWVC